MPWSSKTASFDPLLGIEAAAIHSRIEERLSVERAVSLFSRDAAYLAFQEPSKGTLEEGKQADLVVLSTSPFDVPPDHISRIQVLKTIHRGRIVYDQ